MQIDDHIAQVEAQGLALAAAAERAGLDARVPPCPDWQVATLLGHIGGVHRWATSHLTEGRAAVPDAELATPPTTGLLDWFRAGHAALVQALRQAPDDWDCWSFLPAPSPRAFWARRQAHETAIHHADVALAGGARPAFQPEFAADGIDELLGGFLSRRRGRLLSDPPRSLLVAPVDTDQRWHMTVTAERRILDRAAGPADCTLSGRSGDLYLLLWNRAPREVATVSGDPTILDLWQDLAHITWS